MALGCGGTLESCLLKRGNNSNAKSSWTTSGPIRQDVCGPTLGAWNKRWNLPLRGKGSSLGSGENHISNGVVAVNSVRITAAHNLMINIRVSRMNANLGRGRQV